MIVVPVLMTSCHQMTDAASVPRAWVQKGQVGYRLLTARCRKRYGSESVSARRWRWSAVLWTIVLILFVLWLLGFSFNIGGGLVHILLVLALVVLVYNLVTGRRS